MENMQLTALTELEAVNKIIGTIGESPIDTLDGMTDDDAINALRILRDINRQEQARGWSFNRVPRYTLYPDKTTKKIKWNNNFLFIKSYYPFMKLIHSGDYVKNLFSDSFIFEHPVDVEIVLHVPFEELPDPMRNYIIAKACYVFQNNYFGDESLIKTTQMQVQEAWQFLQEYEIDNNNFSMLDNLHVRKLLMR